MPVGVKYHLTGVALSASAKSASICVRNSTSRNALAFALSLTMINALFVLSFATMLAVLVLSFATMLAVLLLSLLRIVAAFELSLFTIVV